MTEAEVQALAEQVLRERLGPFGYEKVSVRAGFDHDGDPAFFVDATFGREAPSLAQGVSTEALVALSNALLERNEHRFPYLSLHYADVEQFDNVASES